MVTFSGEPNMLVNITPTYKRPRMPKSLRFDANGEYSTEDKMLIKRLSAKFKIKKEYKCKKCEYVTLCMGELLTHHRLNHKENKK